MSPDVPAFVHPTAEVHPDAVLGPGVAVWNWSKVRERARVGAGTSLGQSVYVDHDVVLGAGCKVQNGASLYVGLTVGDDVFIGPHVAFTNDLRPRTFLPDWEVVPTRVLDGASIGANATVVCGVTLGSFCMVAAGAVVTRDVPDHGLVVGTPARLVDYVDAAGDRLGHVVDGTLPAASLLARADHRAPKR